MRAVYEMAAPPGSELFNEMELAVAMAGIKDYMISVHKRGELYIGTARWKTIGILDEEWVNMQACITLADCACNEDFSEWKWHVKMKLQNMLKEIKEKWGYYQ